MQRLGGLLDLLRLVVVEFLVENGVDAILAHHHRQAQEHLLLDSVITLNNIDRKFFSLAISTPFNFNSTVTLILKTVFFSVYM